MAEMEEYGIVIDFLPRGKATDSTPEPLVQLVGDLHFTLLEAAPRKDVEISLGERLYVGKGQRDKIDHIKSRISYENLTSASKGELPVMVEKILATREADFVNFYNKCSSITLRLHQLELLPGVGKKHMKDIMKEREKKPFTSFADINARVRLLPDAKKLLVQRIEEELHGDAKYYILTRPPLRRLEE